MQKRRQKTPNHIGYWFAWFFLFIFIAIMICVALTCVSCTAIRTDDSSNRQIGSIGTRLNIISDNAGAIKPRTDAVGKVLANQIITQAGAGIEEVDNLKSSIDAMNRANVQLEMDLAHWKQSYHEEWNHWLGGKTRQALAWIIGISIAAWAIIGVIGAVVAPHAWVGKTLLNLLPLSNFWAWVANKVHPKQISIINVEGIAAKA